MMTWRDQPNTRHLWAFVYYCRRKGDSVRVTTKCSCYPRKKFCGHPVDITLERSTTQ